jgi:SAM-dependent methyltransferase
MIDSPKKISSDQVRADFNDLPAVIHYTRAAHELGLWRSERALIDRYLPDHDAALLEAGCGAGRVSIALWNLGYRRLTAFDFADELIDQARSLAAERRAEAIEFQVADATALRLTRHPLGDMYKGVLFLFNGLMQIPGRENRRKAMRELRAVSAIGAPFLFTTHDRDHSAVERAMWRLEALRWKRGEQDPRLVEFGDRYFEDRAGRTFMHLPDRAEILADLKETGWTHDYDAMRSEIAPESHAVHEFSDECRFWVARNAG